MKCKNCYTELAPNSNFCNSCGGKVIKNRLTFKNLFEHISETFLNYDNKLLRTLVDLIKRPEAVIDGYVQGIRKRYVNPLSFFGLSLTLSGISIFIIKRYYMDALDFSRYFKGELFDNPTSQAVLENSSSSSFEYGSLILSALIPFMAIISVIVFFDKKYNLTEHVIVYLYSMSALTILSVVIGQIVLWFSADSYLIFALVLYFVMFIYHCYAFKRIFKMSMGDLILRMLFFFVVFIAFYIILGIIMAIIMFLNGDFQQMIDAQKAAKDA